jgi:SAM-dependent methyltransferase
VSWEIFEGGAARYESWYATGRGRRVDRSERALLAWLLGWFPGTRRVLEIGCGTGHFTHGLAAPGSLIIGLDRSPAMLREARGLASGSSLVLADAHRLPLRDRAVDVSALITTLEFLDSPDRALKESIRVAERGLVLVVLNRCSLGALSRRFGPQSRGALLAGARDLPRAHLQAELEKAAGKRLIAMHFRSTLLPRPFGRLLVPLPFGDVLGVAVELASQGSPALGDRPAVRPASSPPPRASAPPPSRRRRSSSCCRGRRAGSVRRRSRGSCCA